MMKEDEEEVKADDDIFSRSEDTLIKDTTIKEKFNVFKMSRRICRYLSGVLFATGAISILLSVEYFLGTKLLLALELRNLFLAVLSLIGGVNLISGLLLLTKE